VVGATGEGPGGRAWRNGWQARSQRAPAPLAKGDPPGIVPADRSLGSGGFRGAMGGPRPQPHVGQGLLDDLHLVVVHVFDGVCGWNPGRNLSRSSPHQMPFALPRKRPHRRNVALTFATR